MMKQLLSGTAIALLVAAGPALAQTTTDQLDEEQLEEEQVEIEAQDDPDPTDEPAEAMEDTDEPDTEAAEIEDELDEPSEAAEIDEEADEPDVAAAPEETFVTMQEENDVLASELMGANVENPEGESLGSINDVVINDELGVKAVVIGVGGFLGIGQKHVAVNYQEIEQIRENGSVTLMFAATRDQLDEAPEFQTLQDQIAEAEQQQMEQQQMQDDQPATGLD